MKRQMVSDNLLKTVLKGAVRLLAPLFTIFHSLSNVPYLVILSKAKDPAVSHDKISALGRICLRHDFTSFRMTISQLLTFSTSQPLNFSPSHLLTFAPSHLLSVCLLFLFPISSLLVPSVVAADLYPGNGSAFSDSASPSALMPLQLAISTPSYPGTWDGN